MRDRLSSRSTRYVYVMNENKLYLTPLQLLLKGGYSYNRLDLGSEIISEGIRDYEKLF